MLRRPRGPGRDDFPDKEVVLVHQNVVMQAAGELGVAFANGRRSKAFDRTLHRSARADECDRPRLQVAANVFERDILLRIGACHALPSRTFA